MEETKHGPNLERTYERSRSGRNQHHSLTMLIWIAVNENSKRAKILWTIREKSLNPKSLREHISSWSNDMEGHAKNCVVGFASWRTRQPRNCTKSQLHALMTINSKNKNWDLLENCKLSIVLKSLYLARIGRTDILWSVNKLARAVTKWTRACDRRLARLISYIHHTCGFKQYCHVGKHCTTMQAGTVSGLRFCRRS